MTERLPESERLVIPKGYTGIVAQYVGKSAVEERRGTEDREWKVPEVASEEVPTPTIEEEDSGAGNAYTEAEAAQPASPPFIPEHMLQNIAASREDSPEAQQ